MSDTPVAGLELSQRFFDEAVRDVVRSELGSDDFIGARIGSGSEVLGFDTERSADHEWGPRCEVFVPDTVSPAQRDHLVATLARQLPKTFGGYPTHFAETGEDGIGVMALTDGPVHHRVTVTTLAAWCTDRLGFDATQSVGMFDWLATPTQRLAECTAGAVFSDPRGELGALRARCTWYPNDLWRYVLACQWRRIAQEEAFVGRTREVGDDLGSRLVTARLAREVVRLALLQARQWPPYSKWLGSAFARLAIADELAPLLDAALTAPTGAHREASLTAAYECVARAQNALELAEVVDPTRREYHGRPYQVIGADRFVHVLRAAVRDPQVARLALVGAVDQFVDSTDALEPRVARAVARAVFGEFNAADAPPRADG